MSALHYFSHLEEQEEERKAEVWRSIQRALQTKSAVKDRVPALRLRDGVDKPSGEAISGALQRAEQTFTDTRSKPCAPNLDPDAEAAKDLTTSKPVSAFDRQVGGSHYKDYKIQTWDLVRANNLDYWQGTIIKYLMRWREKGGVQDLEKAKHTLEAYIEVVRDADPC